VENGKGGIGLGGILTLIFITLKLTGLITWSWWWVLSPIWISLLLFILISIILFVAVNTSKY
jgi:hypothetical protein